LVIAILIGRFGYKFKLITYTTTSANLMLREIGLALFLASVGIKAGAHFWDTVIQGDGIKYVYTGFIITVIPILIVSARRDDIDKIRSLGFGADDYIEKPFSPAVLAARVKSQLARYERLKGTAKENTGIITIGDITLNSFTRIVTVGGKNKLLPNKEFQLLEFLMINADIVFSRETIYNRIWGMESFGSTSTVPVHINRIRDAIEKDPANPQHILTIWGVGYKFRP